VELCDIKNEQDQLDVQIRESLRALDAGRFDEALKLVDGVLFRVPQDPSALVMRGRIHAARGIARRREPTGSLRPSCSSTRRTSTNGRRQLIVIPAWLHKRWREKAEKLDYRP